ncbi:MAG TPA: hypothetical protein VGJ46_10850 [Candidatus Limnocylindrales bacterium]
MTTATLVRPERQATGRFELWLAEHGVPYEVAEGAPSTPWNADDEPPLAKTITVIDDQANPHLLVLDADACLDLGVAAQALNRRWLTILGGSDQPGRVIGHQLEPLAPVELLCGFPIHADEAIAAYLTLTVAMGGGRRVTFSRAAWERAAAIRYSRLTADCRDVLEPIEWY